MAGRDDTEDQIEELFQIRVAKRRRLGVLQVQAARHGIDAPPHVVTEITSIEDELYEINVRINKLQRPQRAATPSDVGVVPSLESLTPVPIVPQTITEHLLAIAAQAEGIKTEVRHEFRAIQLALQRESEDRMRDHETTRALVKEEHGERLEWQANEYGQFHTRHKELARWVWFIGFALLLLVVAFVLYATNQYLRELYLQGGR